MPYPAAAGVSLPLCGRKPPLPDTIRREWERLHTIFVVREIDPGCNWAILSLTNEGTLTTIWIAEPPLTIMLVAWLVRAPVRVQTDCAYPLTVRDCVWLSAATAGWAIGATHCITVYFKLLFLKVPERNRQCQHPPAVMPPFPQNIRPTEIPDTGHAAERTPAATISQKAAVCGIRIKRS